VKRRDIVASCVAPGCCVSRGGGFFSGSMPSFQTRAVTKHSTLILVSFYRYLGKTTTARASPSCATTGDHRIVMYLCVSLCGVMILFEYTGENSSQSPSTVLN
jgi:hypothetical protein